MAHLPGASDDSRTRSNDPNDSDTSANDPRSPSDGQTTVTAGIAAPTTYCSFDSGPYPAASSTPQSKPTIPTPSNRGSKRRKAQSFLELNMEEEDTAEESDGERIRTLETIEKVLQHTALPTTTAANRTAEHTAGTAGHRHPTDTTHAPEARPRPLFVIELRSRKRTPVTDDKPSERKDKSPKKRAKGPRKGTAKSQIIPVSELEPNIELDPKERLVAIEVPRDGVDEIVTLMGTGQWTSEGNDWMASTRDSMHDSRDLYLPSAKGTARRLRRLIGVCDHLSEVQDPAARLHSVGYLETFKNTTVIGRLLDLESQLPEIAADGAQSMKRYEDLSRHVIPLAVILLHSLLQSGARNPPSDHRVFHTIPAIHALTCVVGMILKLDDLVRVDAAACDTEESRLALSDLQSLSYMCRKLMNQLVTARNDIVLLVKQARDDARARERARARQAAKVAEIKERTQRTTMFQASVHAFLSQEGNDSGHEPVEARPRAHMTLDDKYLRVMEELRGSGHPDLEEMAQNLGCSVRDVWEMIGRIREEAERAYEEDGIAIPKDLVGVFCIVRMMWWAGCLPWWSFSTAGVWSWNQEHEIPQRRTLGPESEMSQEFFPLQRIEE